MVAPWREWDKQAGIRIATDKTTHKLHSLAMVMPVISCDGNARNYKTGTISDHDTVESAIVCSIA